MRENKEGRGQIDACPTCERTFREMGDFPRVFVVRASSITLDQVPQRILEGRPEKIDSYITPSAVVDHFNGAFEDPYFEHDGYVYKIIRPTVFDREFNLAPLIRAELETGGSLRKYLEVLEGFVGQEVPVGSALPQWSRAYLPKDTIESAAVLDLLSLVLVRPPRSTGSITAGSPQVNRLMVGIWGGGTVNFFNQILEIGQFTWEGRLNG